MRFKLIRLALMAATVVVFAHAATAEWVNGWP
jgi:hypothetical protein